MDFHQLVHAPQGNQDEVDEAQRKLEAAQHALQVAQDAAKEARAREAEAKAREAAGKTASHVEPLNCNALTLLSSCEG